MCFFIVKINLELLKLNCGHTYCSECNVLTSLYPFFGKVKIIPCPPPCFPSITVIDAPSGNSAYITRQHRRDDVDEDDDYSWF